MYKVYKTRLRHGICINGKNKSRNRLEMLRVSECMESGTVESQW